MNTSENPKLHLQNVMPCFNRSLDDIEGEAWIDIIDYDGIYQVSNFGRIKSIGRMIASKIGREYWIKEKILKIHIPKDGHELNVKLSCDNIAKTYLVNTLVANAFLRDRKQNEVICQLDKNVLNCNLSNLKITNVSSSVYLNYQKGNAKDWGIGNMIKDERKEYELNNGVYENGKLIKIKCSCCNEIKSVNDFYFKKNNIMRECKDCTIKKRGVNNLGESRRRKSLAEKGRRICSVCKQEKDLYVNFGKSKNSFMGRSNNCKECVKKLNAKYRALNKA
jgi:hypothetical protein